MLMNKYNWNTSKTFIPFHPINNDFIINCTNSARPKVNHKSIVQIVSYMFNRTFIGLEYPGVCFLFKAMVYCAISYCLVAQAPLVIAPEPS